MWNNALNERAKAVIADAAAEGIDWPGNYLDNVVERTARLFSEWAGARLHGHRPFIAHGQMTVDSLFEEIWSGELANAVILAELVPDARALAKRRGLTWPTPKPVPAPVRTPVRASVPTPVRWDDRAFDWLIRKASKGIDWATGGRRQVVTASANAD